MFVYIINDIIFDSTNKAKMKTANFTWKSNRNRTVINGTVTLKDDGKTSISIDGNKYNSSPADRDQAKSLAKAIVEADFKHEAVTNFKEVVANDTKGLVSILTELTQDLKEQFISYTENWAKNHFNTIIKRASWKDADWCKFMGITPELKNVNAGISTQFYSFPSGFYNTKGAKVLDRLKNEVRSLSIIGLEKFVEKEVKGAEDHYNDSVAKLSLRLNKKGVVDGSNFNITKAKVGVNLEITIIHDGKTTKAWTIIAEGAIQRPHYRYLVK